MRAEPPTPNQIRALAYLRCYRNARAHGPSWAELADALAWRKGEIRSQLVALRPYGVRWDRGVPRSLRIERPRVGDSP